MATFEPTAAESRMAAALSVVISVAGFVAVVIYNTTGAWLPGAVALVGSAIAAVGMVGWAARSRHQPWLTTARQIGLGGHPSTD